MYISVGRNQVHKRKRKIFINCQPFIVQHNGHTKRCVFVLFFFLNSSDYFEMFSVFGLFEWYWWYDILTYSFVGQFCGQAINLLSKIGQRKWNEINFKSYSIFMGSFFACKFMRIETYVPFISSRCFNLNGAYLCYYLDEFLIENGMSRKHNRFNSKYCNL